jgi:SAM-dependent methyltransferase
VTTNLPLTGERTVPGVVEENYWFRRHEVAYQFVRELIPSGAAVLEVGCGEGYGTDLLAERADIVGIDYDELTIAHAAARYPRATFVRANLAALPFAAASFDAVISMQVVEHVWNHCEYLAECARVLRPGGRLVLSTPNRLTFSPGLDEPANLFHTKEFTADELTDLVRTSGLTVTDVYGLHAGVRLQELDATYGGSFVEAQLAQPPAQWDEQLLADVAAVSVADFPIRRSDGSTRGDSTDIDASLDLIVVATRA